MQFLVSAGEASGDLYAAGVVGRLRQLIPEAKLYGCAGPKLQAAGVEAVVDASSLAVVGLAEVVRHLPRIYGQYRKLLRVAADRKPDAALLTDSPDFNLRVARQLKRRGVPVFYLVAPQVWAWRQSRVRLIEKVVDHLFCLFPFEQQWFRDRGVNATYIGHPLAATVRTTLSRDEFLVRNSLPPTRPIIVLLPGSRPGEIARHLPDLLAAVGLLRSRHDVTILLATPGGFESGSALERFREPLHSLSIKVLEDQTWNCIGYADVALAASGTVTVEAAILGTPMVTFYKVMPLSWYAGRHLVKVPFLTMVNLIAGRRIVPELIQNEMTPAKLAAEVSELLTNDAVASRMRADLAGVRSALLQQTDPFERAARLIAAAVHQQVAATA